MPLTQLDTDYLIVGAGAMSMAFADTLLNEAPAARMIIVDRRARPGGHWVDAYPYVALHQPAAFYGVNSTRLGQGGADLASYSEIQAYYHLLMKRFLASGRVRFFPLSEYLGDGRIVAINNPDQITEISVGKRTVNGGYMNVEVPATTAPSFDVAPEVPLTIPSELPRLNKAWQRYVVAGSGKTGTDAIVFLLAAGVRAEQIQWISPNDSWLWTREQVQPGNALKEFKNHLESIIQASRIDEIFLNLERMGSTPRIDETIRPTKWRCATISRHEVSELRKIRDVVRMGRIRRITANQIELDKGNVPTDTETLHINCTANGLQRREPQPLFGDKGITLQSVFMCQQVFSAAILAHLESKNLDDATRNSVCEIVPHPERVEDHPKCLLASFRNVLNANRYMPIWLRRSRLNLMHHENLLQYLAGANHIKKRLPLAEAALEKMQAH